MASTNDEMGGKREQNTITMSGFFRPHLSASHPQKTLPGSCPK